MNSLFPVLPLQTERVIHMLQDALEEHRIPSEAADGASVAEPLTRRSRIGAAMVVVLTLFLVAQGPSVVPAADLPFEFPAEFAARDSLSIGEDESEDARACLKELVWTPDEFAVVCDPPAAGRGQALVRFQSPVASGDKANDRVALEWYMARDEQRRPKRAHAIVVVHESGSGMQVGRLFARGLQVHGLHAFLIHLPGYGERRGSGEIREVQRLASMIQQAVADVRRARDAVAALPLVDSDRIGLEGTSLGGFVSATSAGLDRGYDRVFIVLAGGNLYDLIQHGEQDAAKVRARLAEAGLEGERLRTLLHRIEPLRLAHRLDPATTWLYSGAFDKVVPPKNAQALADAAMLTNGHHVEMQADHYSGILQLPWVLEHIRDRMSEDADANPPASPIPPAPASPAPPSSRPPSSQPTPPAP